MTTTTIRRRLLTPGLALLLGTGPVATAQPVAATDADNPVDALERNAQPLRTTEPDGNVDDLQPLGAMVGDASVVNVGESTHSSHEFVTVQQRMFRYLAEEKGFRTFAREMSWSTGLLLNEYIQTGEGDPGRIMDRELETFYQVFDNREFLDFVESLREYNETQDDADDRVQIIGTDLAYPGPALFEKVDAYLQKHHPGLRPVFDALHEGLAPKPGMHLGVYMDAYQQLPVPVREARAAKAWAAVTLLKALEPGDDSPHKDAFEWTLQHATAIAQTAKEYSFDTTTPEGRTKALDYRDEIMADNIEWWREHTGEKTMVSNYSAHASYESYNAETVPSKPVGEFLRERLGDDHVSIGLTFAQGRTNAFMEPEGPYKAHRVATDGPEHNEHTLDKVRHGDYLLDLRTAPAEARDWLDTPRKTFAIGGSIDPGEEGAAEFDVALGKSYDILVHLDEVTAAKPRFR